jgi:hypothetical protein
MGVIAKAAVYPGANTLIMNLLSSFSDEDGADDEKVPTVNPSGLDSIFKGRYKLYQCVFIRTNSGAEESGWTRH